LPGDNGQPARLTENQPPASAPAPVPTPVAAPKPYTPENAKPASGQFTVCVASYSTEAAAQRGLREYQNLGKARIIAVDIPGKGRWRRVCIGQYQSFNQAQSVASQMRSAGTAKGAFAARLP
jgi:cell division protein FtsN